MSTIDEIMSEAQVFASTWSLVGGRFDDGSGLEHAEECKAAMRDLIAAALADARREGAEAMRAEIEAQEPVAHYRASDAQWLAMGRCTTVYKAQEEDWKVPLYARPVPAQAVPGAKKFRTSCEGRAEVARFFAEHLRRHDFTRYINDTLAADFACALAPTLHAVMAAAPEAAR